MNYNFMKGGLQFVNIKEPAVPKYLSLCNDGKNILYYKQKEVETYMIRKDNTPLRFTLYNIESFNKYENKTFNLPNLGDDINSIEHLFLCGFLKKMINKNFFIKKGKHKNNNKSFEVIGETLHKICANLKDKGSEKIQIILAHSTEKKALCIIFNMKNIDSKYYNILKNSLPDTLFSDEKFLEGKIEISQLKDLIDFTNEKLVIKSEISKSAEIRISAYKAQKSADNARKSADEAQKSADEAQKSADNARKSADEAQKLAEARYAENSAAAAAAAAAAEEAKKASATASATASAAAEEAKKASATASAAATRVEAAATAAASAATKVEAASAAASAAAEEAKKASATASEAATKAAATKVEREAAAAAASAAGKASAAATAAAVAKRAAAQAAKAAEVALAIARGPKHVRISGIKKDNKQLSGDINGMYKKTEIVRNGRAVYTKMNDQETAMWWTKVKGEPTWCVGHMKNVGTNKMRAYVESMGEFGPEEADTRWQVYSNENKAWEKQTDVKVAPQRILSPLPPITSVISGSGDSGGRVGGGKRKLTRKQLNIMTLTELKQLHKVNKIKMNNNRTIKALINNYIKNYKKN